MSARRSAFTGAKAVVPMRSSVKRRPLQCRV